MLLGRAHCAGARTSGSVPTGRRRLRVPASLEGDSPLADANHGPMPLRIHHFGLIVILEEPISESKRYPNGTSCSVACPSSWCRAANVPTRQVEGCESGQRGFSVAPPAVARDIAVQGMQDSKVRFDTRVTASHERAGSVAVEHPSRPGCHRQVRSGHPIPDRLDSNDDRSATVTTAQPGYREVAQRRTACGLGTGHPRWEYRCLPFAPRAIVP